MFITLKVVEATNAAQLKDKTEVFDKLQMVIVHLCKLFLGTFISSALFVLYECKDLNKFGMSYLDLELRSTRFYDLKLEYVFLLELVQL